MKKLVFFIKHIFLKKWLLVLVFFMLVLLANYLTFIAARSIISTHQGNQDNTFLYQDDLLILNEDPNSLMDETKMNVESTGKVYDYLNQHVDYAFEMNGFLVDLKNSNQIDVMISYVNENFYRLKTSPLKEGEGLSFSDQDVVPILVGAALAKDYPVGSQLSFLNPVTEKEETCQVRGVLQDNVSRSNYYAPNSKVYYNYSIIYPVTEEFLRTSNINLQHNALNDLILLDATDEEAQAVTDVIKQETGKSFNIFSQEENLADFNEYYRDSIGLIIGLTLVMVLVAIILAIWVTLVSIRLSIKEFTINLLVGLSYPNLRRILYQYFAILLTLNMFVFTVCAALMRYQFYFLKDVARITLSWCGLIGMDWLSLLFVLALDVFIAVLIVEIMMRKIKKIPISMGVLS